MYCWGVRICKVQNCWCEECVFEFVGVVEDDVIAGVDKCVYCSGDVFVLFNGDQWIYGGVGIVWIVRYDFCFEVSFQCCDDGIDEVLWYDSMVDGGIFLFSFGGYFVEDGFDVGFEFGGVFGDVGVQDGCVQGIGFGGEGDVIFDDIVVVVQGVSCGGRIGECYMVVVIEVIEQVMG